MIQSSFSLTDADIACFQTKGFVKLKGFFSKEATNCFEDILERELKQSPKVFAQDLNRFMYDMGGDKDFQVIQHPLFQATLTRLCQQSLIYAQHLGFELKKTRVRDYPGMWDT